MGPGFWRNRPGAGWTLPIRMSFGSRTSAVARTQARWMVFSSSRTLPGQPYPSSTRMASSLNGEAAAGVRGRRAGERNWRAAGCPRGARAAAEDGCGSRSADKKVLAKAGCLDFAFQVAVGRGDDAHVGAQRLDCRRRARIRPPAARAGSCSAAGSGMSPISSRKSVPPSHCSNRPTRCAVGAGEGALLVAEQFALEQRLGNRRAIDRHEFLVLTRAEFVDRARHQLLPASALAR